jgi:hypothetical protein
LISLTRRRLSLAAAGSGALELTVIYWLLSIFTRPLQAQLAWVVPPGTRVVVIYSNPNHSGETA